MTIILHLFGYALTFGLGLLVATLKLASRHGMKRSVLRYREMVDMLRKGALTTERLLRTNTELKWRIEELERNR